MFQKKTNLVKIILPMLFISCLSSQSLMKKNNKLNRILKYELKDPNKEIVISNSVTYPISKLLSEINNYSGKQRKYLEDQVLKFIKKNNYNILCKTKKTLNYSKTNHVEPIIYINDENTWYRILNFLLSKDEKYYKETMEFLVEKILFSCYTDIAYKLYKKYPVKQNCVIYMYYQNEIKYIPYDKIYGLLFKHIEKQYIVDNINYSIIMKYCFITTKKNISEDLVKLIFKYGLYPRFKKLTEFINKLKKIDELNKKTE